MSLILRLLTFRITAEELASLKTRHLIFGLFATWVVGMGRWWDDPEAELLQHLGLGSLAYVFLLSGVLFLLVWPLKPERWSYKHVLTFVTLTSPPAILYAIPVERFLSMEVSARVNLWFLVVVALWRLSLLIFYLRRHAGFNWGRVVLATLLPLAMILLGVAMLGLSRGIVQIMGGIRDKTADDLANNLVLGLGMIAWISFIPVLIGYVVTVVMVRRRPQL